MNLPDRLAQVKCFLLDMDGTFYLDNQLLEGALRFIDVLRMQNKDFLFLTNNSSKSRHQYAEKINVLGLPLPDNKVFTSGEATAVYLQGIASGGRLFVVGTPYLEAEFSAHGFILDDAHPD